MKENAMGVKPIPNLILTTSIPLMLSLLINNLYNFIDSVFISHVSEDALTALSMASPVQMLSGALGIGVAVGLNAVISRALGEKNSQKVRESASASLFLAFLAWVILLLCGIFISKPYFAWQSQNNEMIYTYGIQYLSIVLIFSLGQMGQWVFDRFTIASGKTTLFIFTLSAASITNLVLDPILIFGYFGLPAMGAAGAALATVIGQSVGCICGYFINRKYNQEIPIHFTIHPNFKYMKEILFIGIPSTIVQALVSLIGVFMTTVLSAFSTTAVAVYGVCIKIQNLCTVPVHGINNGLIPVVAYNFGANKTQRIKESIRWSYIYSGIAMLVISIFLELYPETILRIFDASQVMLDIGVDALRILTISWILSVISLILAAVFQGYGLGFYSMILNTARQVLFIFVFVVILKDFGLIGIWSSFVMSEIVAIPLAYFLYQKTKKRYIV